MQTKRCTICAKILPLAEFNINRARKDGLQTHCRECNRKTSRAYYQRHLFKHRAVIKLRQQRIRSVVREHIWQYFASHPCVDCGEKDRLVLQFDHVRGQKIKDVSYLVSFGSSWDRIQAEIAKCDVRCANCHARRTALASGDYRAVFHLKYKNETSSQY